MFISHIWLKKVKKMKTCPARLLVLKHKKDKYQYKFLRLMVHIIYMFEYTQTHAHIHINKSTDTMNTNLTQAVLNLQTGYFQNFTYSSVVWNSVTSCNYITVVI